MRNLNSESNHLARWFVMAAIIWSGMIGAAMYWNYTNEKKQAINMASTEARAHFNKDTAIRFWSTSHGGVYVPIDENTPPNPRLSHIPERDITTPSGRKLTLMNPAYMLRSMANEYENLYGVKGKITTFPDKLFYQGNMPDAWELAALQSFQRGVEEVKEIADIDGVPHMRLMRPLYIQQGCLKCHDNQGYKVGDLRGGVGVALSMQLYLQAESENIKMQMLSLFFLWLIGLFVLVYFFSRTKAHARELFDMEHRFHQAQKMEALGTLVGGIAHDFNNMLAGMTGNLYLAKKKVQGNPDVVQKLDNVEKLSFRAAEMIHQLLTFARKDRVSMQEFPLTPFIKEAIKLLQVSVPENIDVVQNICSDALQINGDGTQIHQVLLNLLNNARDAVEGVDDPRITISLKPFHADEMFIKNHTNSRVGSYAHLVIEDNGCGIPNNKLEHLFEPFFTTKEQGKGTGLGLAMVFGAINTHSGFVEVESIEGKGSSFHVYIPLLETEHVAPSLQQEQGIIQGYGEMILLVDDEEHIREVGREVLEELGYQVIEASDGLEAVDIFISNQDKIALIIMDIVMPRLGGVKAIERIRGIRPDIKVIFSTGYDKEATLPDKMQPSEAVILSKPFNIETLSKTIREHLDS